jgi:hypothetical protein
MSSKYDKFCLENGEPENDCDIITLIEKARNIGFSDKEIAELNRLYAVRKKVRK